MTPELLFEYVVSVIAGIGVGLAIAIFVYALVRGLLEG